MDAAQSFNHLAILLFICRLIDIGYAGISERHLINHLLSNYNPLERPVANENETLNVIFGITLQQIIDVDEKNQILISNLWLKLQWIDINLRWNPEDYGGIEILRLSTDRIWIPDVLMYNSADERFDSTFRTNVVVNYTGGCLYVPPGIFKSTCHIDITWFPFDDQLCELKFGSWSYDGLSVDLVQENASADTSPYLPNGEWVLVDVPSIRTSQIYECCPGPFVDIKFIIHIKRRTLYYGFNLIIPCIILSSMTLLSFSLPPESGEKLHLGVTILLSMTVFLVQLSKILPATSDSISIIALYFGSVMVMVAVSVVMTVVVLNFHHRSLETKEMGPKLRKFLLDWLPRLLHMERPGIKPPKQCIKKASSKSKLNCPLDFTKHATIDDRNAPSVDSNINCNNSTNTIPIDNKNLCSNEYSLSRNLFGKETTDDTVIYEHENDCIYNSTNKEATANDCDSIDLTKTDEMIIEDEIIGIEDCLEEDLDLEVSITLDENDKGKKELKNEPGSQKMDNKFTTRYEVPRKNSASKDATNEKCFDGHMEMDAEHYVRHQHMALKRRYKLVEILIEMRFITDRLRREDQIKELISEWRYGATVLDRLCLILFTLLTILSLAICLISAPQLIV